MQSVIGSLLLLFFFLLVLHSLWQWGRHFPPATHEAPSGVEGGLLLIVAGLLGLLIFNATGFGLMVTAIKGTGVWPANLWMSAVIPGVLSLVGVLWALLRLLSGRTPRVRWEASIGCLVSGPLAEGWWLFVGSGDITRCVFLSVAAIAIVIYLMRSSRSRHTYGSSVA